MNRNRSSGFPDWRFLRASGSPGYLQNLVAQAAESGVLIASNPTSEDVAIRQVLWLNLNTP